ncbi:hypothetical protein RhiirB3_490449 [Rhizophagus irregularis]|nr:hypothetical protein RhiirB3_490449 [Rhizophagus irregularis]
MIRTQSISLRTVIAETFERYKSMRVGQLKYIDSFQFMNHGLATLGENIDKNRCMGYLEKYKITMKHYMDKGIPIEMIVLLLRKDMEMHDFAEKARRGGITMACRRYFRANNPKCKNFYMRSPKTWLSYVDANNLYGWAMSQYLPIGGNNKKVLDTILKKRNDASRGYYVQLECHFPSQTHNYLQDLPPTVENIKVVDEVRKVLSFDSLTGSKDLYNVLGQSWLTVHEAIINLCRSEISLYGMSIPFIDEEELYSDKDLYYEFRELLTKKYFRGGNDHKLHDSLSESSESSVSSVSSVICDIPRKNK